MPWIPWNDVLDKFRGKAKYEDYRFFNEVLGYSYDNSEKVLTIPTCIIATTNFPNMLKHLIVETYHSYLLLLMCQNYLGLKKLKHDIF
jgi:hypothetical protein